MIYAEAQNVAIEAVMHQHAMQNVHELATMLLRVAAIRPERICEIGCMLGGTLYCWPATGAGHVYGITEPVNDPSCVRPHGAEILFADSHTAGARDWLAGKLAGEPLDVLFIDGDHSAAGVRADWADYSPLVRPGGLVIVHDIVFMPEVHEWWREFRASPQPPGRVLDEIYAGGQDLPAAPGVGFITIEGAAE